MTPLPQVLSNIRDILRMSLRHQRIHMGSRAKRLSPVFFCDLEFCVGNWCPAPCISGLHLGWASDGIWWRFIQVSFNFNTPATQKTLSLLETSVTDKSVTEGWKIVQTPNTVLWPVTWGQRLTTSFTSLVIPFLWLSPNYDTRNNINNFIYVCVCVCVRVCVCVHVLKWKVIIIF